MIEPEVELASAKAVSSSFESLHREAKRKATALLLGGTAAAGALAYTIAEVNPSNEGFSQLAISGETMAMWGLFLLGGVEALQARRYGLARESADSELKALEAQVTNDQP